MATVTALSRTVPPAVPGENVSPFCHLVNRLAGDHLTILSSTETITSLSLQNVMLYFIMLYYIILQLGLGDQISNNNNFQKTLFIVMKMKHRR